MLAGVTEAKAALRQKLAEAPCPDWSPIIQRFQALPELEQANTVLLFYGIGSEPDTRGTITELLRRGKTVALPCCLPGRSMEGRIVTDLSLLQPGTYGIPEPDKTCPVIEPNQIDLILVPSLCCDKQGYRLGHGAGYYDRYLAGYVGITVSLCPNARLQDSLPRDSYDLPVGLVLTESRIWRGAEAPRRSPEESADAK